MELLRTLLIAILLVGCALMAHGRRSPGGPPPKQVGPSKGGPPQGRPPPPPPICGFVLQGVENVAQTDACPDKCSVEIDFTIEGVDAKMSLCDVDDDNRKPPRDFDLVSRHSFSSWPLEICYELS